MLPCRFAPIALFALLTSTGCSPSADANANDESSSAAITGRLSDAIACEVRSAYTSASVSDTESVPADTLPPSVKALYRIGQPDEATPVAVRSMSVPGIGKVYIVELTRIDAQTQAVVFSFVAFYAADGRLLTAAQENVQGVWDFRVPYPGEGRAPISMDDAVLGPALICN